MVLYLSKYNNKRLWNVVDRSIEQIEMEVTKDSAEILDKIWRTSKYFSNITMFKTPSDLIFAKTIATLDTKYTYYDGDTVLDYRVILYENYDNRIDDAMKNNTRVTIPVGIFVFTSDDKQWCVPINVTIGNDEIEDDVLTVGYRISSLKEYDNILDIDMQKIFDDGMRIWYGLQMYLLHPERLEIERESRMANALKGKKLRQMTKEERKIIQEAAVEVIDDFEKNNKLIIEKVKTNPYIAKLSRGIRDYFTEEEINESINRAIKRTDRKINRKSPIWSVVGHWAVRHDTGKKYFVKSHWKGPLAGLFNGVVKIPKVTVNTNYGDYSTDRKIDPENWNLGKDLSKRIDSLENVIKENDKNE